MATGALDSKGIYQYGEDDSETTFSALLNKLAGSVSNTMKGRIAQVVYGSTTTLVSNGTGTDVNTSLSATITPTSASSKIMVLVTQNGVGRAGSSQGAVIKLWRETTQVALLSSLAWYNGSNVESWGGSVSSTFVETPGVTTAITYKTTLASAGAANIARVQIGNELSTIILVEVTA